MEIMIQSAVGDCSINRYRPQLWQKRRVRAKTLPSTSDSGDIRGIPSRLIWLSIVIVKVSTVGVTLSECSVPSWDVDVIRQLAI
jgi:hypothetical protein